MKLTAAQRKRKLPGWHAMLTALTKAQAENRDIDVMVGSAFGWVSPSGWVVLPTPTGTLRGHTTVEELQALIAG